MNKDPPLTSLKNTAIWPANTLDVIKQPSTYEGAQGELGTLKIKIGQDKLGVDRFRYEPASAIWARIVHTKMEYADYEKQKAAYNILKAEYEAI